LCFAKKLLSLLCDRDILTNQNQGSMQQIVIDLQPQIANKFNAYVQLFGSKDLLFEKFVDYHVNRTKREIVRMQLELDKFEEKYHINTNEFYKAFENGQFGDENDFMIWAGIYELQVDSKSKLNCITINV